VQLRAQLPVHGVQDFRAIQRDNRHSFFVLYQDMLVRHLPLHFSANQKPFLEAPNILSTWKASSAMRLELYGLAQG
jgi:hypothetical protein